MWIPLSLACALAAACGGEKEPDGISREEITVSPKGVVKLDQQKYRAPPSTGPTQMIVVTVADSDLNADPAVEDTVQVTIGIAGSPVPPEPLTLTETGASTGVFTGTIQLLAGAEVEGNGILEAKDSDTIVATYQDANDGTGRAVTVTAPATVDNHSPDLTVASVGGPAAAAPGSTVAVSFSVANEPLGGAAGPFQVSIQLLGSSGIVSSATVDVTAGLAASATFDGQVTLAIPSGLGTYTYNAVVDPAGAVAEFDETNNETVGNTVVAGPDLTISVLTGPTTINAGETASLTFTVTNLGSAAGASVTTLFFTQLNGNPLNPSVAVNVSVPPLDVGESWTSPATPLAIPAGLNGGYLFKAVADSYGYVAETAESNNTLTRPVTVVGADLTITALTGPDTINAGDSATLTFTIVNSGQGAAVASITTLFFTQLNGNPLNPSVAVNVSVPPLDTGESWTSPATHLAIPAGLNGGYLFKAVADSYGYVAETSESNNTLTRPVTVIGADLTITALTGPDTINAGDIATLTFTIVNSGQGAAVGSITTLSLRQLDGNPLNPSVAVNVSVPPLDTGESWTSPATQLAIPAGLNGGYLFKAVADSYGYVAETSESNNTLTRPVQVN